jgi:uncharacterized protein
MSTSSAMRRLPLYFERIKEDKVFVSSESGRWLVVTNSEFDEVVNKPCSNSSLMETMVSHGLLEPAASNAIKRLEGLRIRDAYSAYLQSFSYFIVVTTLRCNQTCDYCQVSRKPESSPTEYDLGPDDAIRIANLILTSPRKSIKLEFQGGEATLNVEFISRLLSHLSEVSDKDIRPVICSNLAELTPGLIELCKKYKIEISTSLDGPKDLHTFTRKHRDKNYFEGLVANIRTVQHQLGSDQLSAVLTVSAASLPRIKDIVRFYRSLSLDYISFRHITDIGFARRGAHYSFDDWFSAYKSGLEEVISINRQGFYMVEGITILYLRKLLSDKNHIFVDQNNPNVMGLNALVVNYDGEIYLSDESRMLAEEGDKSLALGLNIKNSTFSCEEIISTSLAKESIAESQLISSPICATCAFQSHCGNDLVYNYNTNGKLTGYKPYSFICQRTKSVIGHILDLLADPETKTILESWLTKN